MTGSAGLLEALPRHQTAHAALLADILDVLHGSSPAAKEQSSSPPAEELSPGELRVLRYLPTNLSRPEIAGELSVSPNTVSAHIRSIYAKLGVRDRSAAVRRARELRLLAAAGATPAAGNPPAGGGSGTTRARVQRFDERVSVFEVQQDRFRASPTGQQTGQLAIDPVEHRGAQEQILDVRPLALLKLAYGVRASMIRRISKP
jgi:DNA-binding CsgD family transcriptional regulator